MGAFSIQQKQSTFILLYLKKTKAMAKSKKLQKFIEQRKHYTQADFNHEMLHALWEIQNRAERTRANTSIMVWFLIVIPLLIGVIAFIF